MMTHITSNRSPDIVTRDYIELGNARKGDYIVFGYSENTGSGGKVNIVEGHRVISGATREGFRVGIINEVNANGVVVNYFDEVGHVKKEAISDMERISNHPREKLIGGKVEDAFDLSNMKDWPKERIEYVAAEMKKRTTLPGIARDLVIYNGELAAVENVEFRQGVLSNRRPLSISITFLTGYDTGKTGIFDFKTNKLTIEQQPTTSAKNNNMMTHFKNTP